MRIRLLTVAALCIASQANAGSLWTEDKFTNSLIVSANVLAVMDWAQTRYIADNPDRFEETGPAADALGKHPSRGDVNRYFAQGIIVWNAIGYFLPESATTFGMSCKPKQVFYIGMAAYEGRYVVNNREIGIRMQF
jgi:hypothetical protein